MIHSQRPSLSGAASGQPLTSSETGATRALKRACQGVPDLSAEMIYDSVYPDRKIPSFQALEWMQGALRLIPEPTVGPIISLP